VIGHSRSSSVILEKTCRATNVEKIDRLPVVNSTANHRMEEEHHRNIATQHEHIPTIVDFISKRVQLNEQSINLAGYC
jgi:hypothetical protein